MAFTPLIALFSVLGLVGCAEDPSSETGLQQTASPSVARPNPSDCVADTTDDGWDADEQVWTTTFCFPPDPEPLPTACGPSCWDTTATE